MPTVLTQESLRELEQLLLSGRRDLSSVYREWKIGVNLQTMAESRGHEDLKKIKNTVSALRILFGREDLPKQGKGRQQALYEAHYWLHSDHFLSSELTEHFEKLLLRGDKTNSRRGDYEPLLPPTKRTVYQAARDNTRNGDHKGIYIVSRKSAVELHELANRPLLLKVGWSNNVWDRISNAQTWEPDKLQVLRLYYCDNPNILETKFHIVLDTLGCAYDGDGGREWFEISGLEVIDGIAAELGLENAVSELSEV